MLMLESRTVAHCFRLYVKAIFSINGSLLIAKKLSMKLNESGNEYPLISGGFVGFFVVFIVGWFVGNDLGVILRNPSIGAIIGLISIRGFLFVFEFYIDLSQTKVNKRDFFESSNEVKDS